MASTFKPRFLATVAVAESSILSSASVIRSAPLSCCIPEENVLHMDASHSVACLSQAFVHCPVAAVAVSAILRTQPSIINSILQLCCSCSMQVTLSAEKGNHQSKSVFSVILKSDHLCSQ